jgi:hypothetical protein
MADGAPPDAPGADAATPDAAGADAAMPDASSDHTPPTLAWTDPGEGAAHVEPTQAITVSFDELVTVSEPADGLLLLDEAGYPVAGAVEVDGNTLRFVPADDLALLGSYTAVVTTAVTDRAGNPLASEHRFQLAVRDGAWELPGTLIEDSDSDVLRTPDAAMNPRGDVVAVWSQLDPPFSIWANHYDAHTGEWGTAQPIEHDDAGDAVAPRVAMGAAGDAIAVWQQFDGAHHHVWASRYDAGAGWGEPVQLDEGNTGDASEPRIAMNAGGAAVVAWQQREGGQTQPWIRRHAAGTGWGVADPVHLFGQPAFMLGPELAVAIDGEGNALVLMIDDDFTLQAVPHLAASGWGEPESLQRGPIEGFDVALSPGGAALVTWYNAQPARILAWSRAPDGASRTDILMLVHEEERGSLRPGVVTINPAGDGIALWFQDSPGPRQVWAGIYAAAARAWGAPQSVFSSETLRPRSPLVAMDPRGHAHASWIASDGNDYQVLGTARRVAPGGFSASILFEHVENASLAVNAQGKAVLIRAVQSCDGAHIDLDAVFFR